MITFRKKEILCFICILIPILIFSPYLIKRSKSKFYRYKRSILIKKLEKEKNCNFEYINKIPKDSTLIIGHAYGSRYSQNGFIDKKLEKLLREKKSIIKNLFLTGDVFFLPTKENWQNLYNILEQDTQLIIAPGNHDLGSLENKKIFKSSIKHSLNYPIFIKTAHHNYIAENSTTNSWRISKKTIKKINESTNENSHILLRHNIAVQELLPLANSLAGLKKTLPTIKELQEKIKKKVIIVSGDSGAKSYLPRFYCLKKGNLKFVINGIGSLDNDVILVISEGIFYKYKLNSERK